MMCVIINDRYPVDMADKLVSATYAAKRCEGAGGGMEINATRLGEREDACGIERQVYPRFRERYLDFGPGTRQLKPRTPVDRGSI
jgi:hypothetical protein